MWIGSPRSRLRRTRHGVLIDTSLLVAAERESVKLEKVVHPGEDFALPVVTAAKLLHGVHRAPSRWGEARSAYVEASIAAPSLIPIDLILDRAYAQASVALAESGAPVEANDLWIGATAIAHGLELLALDGDFDRIPRHQEAAHPVNCTSPRGARRRSSTDTS